MKKAVLKEYLKNRGLKSKEALEEIKEEKPKKTNKKKVEK